MNTTWTGRKPWHHDLSRWWLLFGVLVGVLFLLGMQLKLKWFAFLFLGSMVLMASLAAPNKKDYCLALFVLALPVWIGKHFDYHPSPYGISTFGFPIHLSLLPLTALYVIWAVGRVVPQEPAPLYTRGLLPLAGVFGAAAVSALMAQDKLFAAFDLFALSTSMLIYIYVASEIRQRRELHLVLTLLIFSAALQGGIALAQYLTGSSLGLDFAGVGRTLYGFAGLEVVSRVGGLIGHPNNLALFFDLMLPLSLSLLFCPWRGHTRFFLAVAVFLQVVGLGVTFSRGGIIASSLALISLAVFHGARRFGLVRALFLTLVGALLITVFLAIVPNPFEKGLTRTEQTAHGRWPLAEIALNMIQHHPLFGVGLNNFTHASRRYDFTQEQIVSAWNAPVHNLFLFMAGEIGLVGLICFLVFLAKVMAGLIPAMRSPDPFILSVGAGLFFGLMAFLIHAQVDYSIWTQNRPLWFLLGLAMCVGRFARTAPPTSPQGFR
ncbi:MAG: O-antigen ligase family protein [Desulfobaccales bacterium]